MKNKDEIIPSTPSIEPKIRSKWSRIKKKLRGKFITLDLWLLFGLYLKIQRKFHLSYSWSGKYTFVTFSYPG